MHPSTNAVLNAADPNRLENGLLFYHELMNACLLMYA